MHVLHNPGCLKLKVDGNLSKGAKKFKSSREVRQIFYDSKIVYTLEAMEEISSVSKIIFHKRPKYAMISFSLFMVPQDLEEKYLRNASRSRRRQLSPPLLLNGLYELAVLLHAPQNGWPWPG